MLNQYEKGALLHQSANSVVYQAKNTQTGEQVALKQIPFQGSRERLAFYKEIELLQKVKNLPHFVQLRDFFEEQGSFYVITRYIHGKSLSQLNVSQDQLLGYFRQAAGALSKLHGEGILHGDIKGKNFLIDDEKDFLYFLDLGGGIYHTGEEYLKSGTLAYMSPEQLGFIRYPAGEYTDLYGLGVSFYELFAGELPFAEKDKSRLINKILTEKVPSLKEKCEHLPHIYDEIIQKLLSKDPADRYQSASGLLHDLEEAAKNSSLKFQLGQKDQSGRLMLEGKPIGFEGHLSELKRFFISKVPCFIHGGKGSGKSTLLAYLKKEYIEEKIVLLELWPEDKEEKGGFFKILFSMLAKELGKNTLGDFLSSKRPEEINPYLPEGLRKEGESGQQELNMKASEDYQGEFLFELLNFLSGLNIYLFIDNAEYLDDFSLTILARQEFSQVLCTLSSVFLQRFQFSDLQMFPLELSPFSSQLLEAQIRQILQEKISEENLEFLLANLGEEKIYPGELAEYLFSLKEQELLWFEPRENQWKLNQGKLKGITIQGFYQKFIQEKIAKISRAEKEILWLLSLLSVPVREEDFSDYGCFYSEDEERAPQLQVLSLIESLVKQGLLVRENLEVRVEPALRSLFNQMELEGKPSLKMGLLEQLSKNKQLYYKDMVELMWAEKKQGLKETLEYQVSQEKQRKNNYQVFSSYVRLILICERERELTFYCEELMHYKYFARFTPEFEEALEKIALWEREKDLQVESKIKILAVLVSFNFVKVQYAKALEYGHKLAPLAEKNQNYQYLYVALGALAGIHFFSNNLLEAERTVRGALGLKEKNVEMDREGYNYAILAFVLTVKGDKEEALRNALLAVQKAYKSNELTDLGVCLHFCGFVYSYFGKFEEGLEFSQEALQLSKKLKNFILEYSAHYSIAMAYIAQDILSEAEKHLQESLKMARSQGLAIGLDWVYRLMMELYFRTKEKKKFEQVLRDYAELEKFQQHPSLYLYYLCKNRAISSLFQSDYEGAETELKRALMEAEKAGVKNKIERSKIYGLLYFLYQELGEFSRAQEHYRQAEACFDELDMKLEKKYYLSKSWASAQDDSISSLNTSSRSMKESMAYESILRATAIISSIMEPKKMVVKLMDILLQTFGAEKGYFCLEAEGKKYLLCCDQELKKISKDFVYEDILAQMHEQKEARVIDSLEREYPERKGEKSVLAFPILRKGKVLGEVYLANHTLPGIFSGEDIKILAALMNQTLIAIENAIHFVKEKEARAKAEATMKAFQLFVPSPFLKVIAREGIDSIRLGNASAQKVTIFFSDIRDFTAISEQLAPEELMRYLNRFMSEVTGRCIEERHGFIDKFIGDAVMAVFDQLEADNAVQAAVDIQRGLVAYNQKMVQEGLSPIKVGIGLNTGQIIMGTIGTHTRMDSTIIGDEVNLASRLESLTKLYGVPIIISASTVKNLKRPEDFSFREIDSVTVAGKSIPVTIYEVFNWEREEVQALKKSYESDLLMGITFYKIQQFEEAFKLFSQCYELNPSDPVVCLYLSRCQQYMDVSPDAEWDGTVQLLKK